MRALVTAGLLCLLAFTAVPLLMTGIVGSDSLGQTPTTVFLAPAQVVFGSAGRVVVGVMLACALILGAQAYLIASSRTIYQLSRDAHLHARLVEAAVLVDGDRRRRGGARGPVLQAQDDVLQRLAVLREQDRLVERVALAADRVVLAIDLLLLGRRS